jgi:hypothetical protein
MIKKILAPVQAWILLQGKCVGCGQNLALAKKYERPDNSLKVVCKCARIYIFEKRKGKYRRANFNEA